MVSFAGDLVSFAGDTGSDGLNSAALQLVRAIATKANATADLRKFIESRLSRLLGQENTAPFNLTSSLERLKETLENRGRLRDNNPVIAGQDWVDGRQAAFRLPKDQVARPPQKSLQDQCDGGTLEPVPGQTTFACDRLTRGLVCLNTSIQPKKPAQSG